jgi:hypothetical protein
MAERFRQVHPDQIVTFNDGRELAVVSEEHFVNEVAKIASFIAFAGGTMSAVVYRQPTDLRGEMVTVGAVLSWADFTKTRAQPEPASMPPGYEEPPTPDEVVADVQESRDGGLGAAALPFQDDGETSGPVEFALSDLSPEQRKDVETLADASPSPQVYVAQPGPPPAGHGVLSNVTEDGEPILPRPGRDDDVDDGLSGIGGEDLSEIPESLR